MNAFIKEILDRFLNYCRYHKSKILSILIFSIVFALTILRVASVWADMFRTPLTLTSKTIINQQIYDAQDFGSIPETKYSISKFSDIPSNITNINPIEIDNNFFILNFNTDTQEFQISDKHWNTLDSYKFASSIFNTQRINQSDFLLERFDIEKNVNVYSLLNISKEATISISTDHNFQEILDILRAKNNWSIFITNKNQNVLYFSFNNETHSISDSYLARILSVINDEKYLYIILNTEHEGFEIMILDKANQENRTRIRLDSLNFEIISAILYSRNEINQFERNLIISGKNGVYRIILSNKFPFEVVAYEKILDSVQFGIIEQMFITNTGEILIRQGLNATRSFLILQKNP